MIYTDGSCLGNPGPGGYCAIIERELDNEIQRKVVKGGNAFTTNNKMELTAVIEALKSLKNPYEIEIISDSQYVCRSINEWLDGWIKKSFKDVKNLELWKEYIELSKKHKIKATWVKAHDGHPENEECDRISKQEAQKFQ